MRKAMIEVKNKFKELLNGSPDDREKIITTVVAEGGCPVGLAFKQELPLDLVYELCLILPVLKLFQFRCVSKFWNSIVVDPDFYNAYCSLHPLKSLVISFTEVYVDGHSSSLQFYHSLLGEEWVSSPLKIQMEDYHEFTDVINGLVCAFTPRGMHHCVLCNIWTREVISLPNSHETHYFPSTLANYYFAFEPVNRLYKLLKLTSYSNKVLSFKILTIGNSSNSSSWRELPVPENIALIQTLSCRSSIVINGVMFFRSASEIYAFNFSGEEFSLVPVPVLPTYDGILYDYNLTQFKGQLTLLRQPGIEEIVIHKLNDDGSYSWTSRQTILPRELQSRCHTVFPVGNLPTGEILVAPISDTLPRRNSLAQTPLTMLYSYDFEKDKFEKIDVGKFPQPMYFRYNDPVISCVEESVGSLDALIHGDGCFT